MSFHVARPSADAVRRFLDAERTRDVTYPDAGATRDRRHPPGFTRDHNRERLGTGAATFARACDALRAWRQFPARWTAIEPPDTPLVTGHTLGVLIHTLGGWWLNSARIIYVIDEPRRFGLAYGTLPGHAECGEERFLVEQLPDDTVWYDLFAFSRPRHWAARVGYPVTRALQRRFARDSMRAMREAA